MPALLGSSSARRSRATSTTLAVILSIWGLAGELTSTAPSPEPQNAASAGRTVWDSVFSSAQAARGQAVYKRTCSECHRDDLSGSDGPPLRGLDFFIRWRGQTVKDMLEELQATMPMSKPGSVDPQTFLDVLGFLFQANGVPVGTTDLVAEPNFLDAILITEKP